VLPRKRAFLVPKIESCDPDKPQQADLTLSGRTWIAASRHCRLGAVRYNCSATLLPWLDDALLETAVNTLPPHCARRALAPVPGCARGAMDCARRVRAWYEVLAPEVDVHLSDKDDLAVATLHPKKAH
jgi:hypothetical protein